MAIDVEQFLAKAEVLKANEGKLNKIKDLQQKLKDAYSDLPPELLALFPESNGTPQPNTEGKRGRKTAAEIATIDQKVMGQLSTTKAMTNRQIQEKTGLDSGTVSGAIGRNWEQLKKVKADQSKKEGPLNVAWLMKK